MPRVATLAFVVALTACGTGAPPPRELEVDLVCASEVACGYFPDLASCLRGHPVDPDPLPDTIVYHADVAARCLDRARSYGCYQRGVPYPQIPCEGAFEGLVTEGGACRVPIECVAGTYCDLSACGTDVCCVGECVALPITPPSEVGQPCVDGTCVAGAYCQSGRCAPQATSEGAACDGPSACAIPFMCMGAVCRTFGAPGDACDSARICEPSSEYCGTDGRCALRGAPGAPCSDATPCSYDASCIDGTCVLVGDVGEPCTFGCFVSLECVSGVCQPRHPRVTCPP